MLTKRELEIVEYIYKGYTNKEISNCLFISSSTVKRHIHNILKKLQLNNRVHIIIYERDNKSICEK
jgi:DNA-binding NarL/FixJ family response regulator